MSLSRTSCDNSMHYYSFTSPSPAMAPFASSSLSSLPTKASLWIFSPHITTLSRVCPFLFLSSLLAANVVALSFLPTSLAAYILFWGEIFPFLDGIIWFIILLFFARPNFLSNNFRLFSRLWVPCSTTGHSLRLDELSVINLRVSGLLRGSYRNQTTSILEAASSACSFYEHSFYEHLF